MISPRAVAAAHAAYYVCTGLWSILHRRSFEAVSGPKREYWLVRTVGALATAVGAALGAAVVTGGGAKEPFSQSEAASPSSPRTSRQRVRRPGCTSATPFCMPGCCPPGCAPGSAA